MLNRLAGIYDEIYVDEFQDMAGWDFDFIRILLQSRIRVLLVGDPRQYTYRTNDAKKNSQYCGIGILKLASEWASENLCQLENHARSYRCNQKICDYADTLWPDLEPTLSLNYNTTSHDGIFVVASTELHEYIKTFSPAILRYDRRTPAYGFSASNFGVVKGITFGRVLILSHGKIKNYLKSGNVEDVAKSIEKFYVAVTRARFSVAFLYDGVHGAAYTKWEPDSTVPTRLATGSKDPDS
ncbi:MAG: UvrD-helicase domain-containing protein [Planctomycetes bacterium]|nr:UvrD-helicase domain-containing protein [Planctomycetota bacterium]